MSANHGPAAAKGTRSPTYAEAARAAARPPPIDTTVERADLRSGISSGTTASSAQGSNSRGSVGSMVTTATSLYPPSIWSPIPDQTKSATIAKKVSWEAGLKQSGLGRDTRVATPLIPQARSKGATGLGPQLGQFNTPTDATTDESISSARLDMLKPISSFTPFHHIGSPYQYKQHNIPEPQSSPYIRNVSDSLAKTFPLTQYAFDHSHGFGNQHRMPPSVIKSPQADVNLLPVGADRNDLLRKTHNVDDDAASGITNPYATNELPTRPDSAVDHDANASEVAVSEITKIGEMEDGVRLPDEIIEQAGHSKSFSSLLRFTTMPSSLEAAYPQAFVSLKSLNDSFLQVSPSVRMICIKTDLIVNVQWSVQRNVWGIMDKVGQRIMRVWEARESDKEKVYLLFSINGQKSYCGLAEMSGPYHQGGDLKGWQFGKDDMNAWGTVPVTWRYVKNVSYGWFAHIRHSHNDGSITNMWNGMHFPLDSGREVLKTYIERPHFTNIICWEKNGAYQPMKGNTQPWQIDPDLASKGSGGGRKGPPPRLMIENGRASGDGDRAVRGKSSASGAAPQSDDAAAPTTVQKGKHHLGRGIAELAQATTAMTPKGQHQGGAQPSMVATPPIIDGHVSPATQPGQLVQCIMDMHGNYIPVTPGGRHPHSPGFQAYANSPSIQHPMHGQQQYPPQSPHLTNMYPSKHSNIMHPNNLRGRGNGRPGRGGFPSPAHATRSFTAEPTPRPPHFPNAPMSPAIRHMNSLNGLVDVFHTPNQLRPMQSMGHLSPYMHMPSGMHSPAMQPVASPANFRLQQNFNRSGPVTVVNVHNNLNFVNNPQVPSAIGLRDNEPTLPGAPPGAPPGDAASQNENSVTNSSSLPHGTHADAEIPSLSEITSLSEIKSTLPDSNFETSNEADKHLTDEQKHLRIIELARVKLQIDHEIARLGYVNDSRRTLDHDADRPDGSEAGGMAAWVSTSTLENRMISPVSSLNGDDFAMNESTERGAHAGRG